MNWIRNWRTRQIALALIMGLFIIGGIPAESMAYMAGSSNIAASARAADMDRIQRALESKLVAEKLGQAGLSMPEAKARIEKLSDQDLHSFAKQVDTLYVGGDLGVVIAILIIVILVLVILKIQNKKIIIQ